MTEQVHKRTVEHQDMWYIYTCSIVVITSMKNLKIVFFYQYNSWTMYLNSVFIKQRYGLPMVYLNMEILKMLTR